MSERLFSVGNSFHTGAYQACINDGADLDGLSEQEEIERDYYVNRAYICSGQASLVLSQIGEDVATALVGVKLLAQYVEGGQKESVMSTLAELMADPLSASNSQLCVMAATVFLLDGAYDEALKACASANSLEGQAVMVQAYLQLERPDLAEKQLRTMQANDDDATLTQLATAWVNVTLGGLKTQEASYIYQELGDKFSWTTTLHNGLAVCQMAMGRFEEAEKELQDALNKDPRNPETLANLVTCAAQLGKPSVARYKAQLLQAAPNHVASKRLEAADDMFSRAMVQMSS